MIRAQVDFSRKLQDWDGFGVNYVETCQTFDYAANPQDYGGFSTLAEDKRREILDLIFGESGLKPGIVKMFLDPFHQDEKHLNEPGPENIDQSNYSHTATTKWLRYFAREGLARTRSRGGELSIITTMYGPPGWMTKQRIMRGRDLEPAYKMECAKYMVSWAKYLKEKEGLPVKYISLHNEGEDWMRWPEDGGASWEGHDYNMFWPPEQVVEFLKLVRRVLDSHGMQDVGVTPGETTCWYRFLEWGYAYAVADDPEAVRDLGLLTSHGFVNYAGRRWFEDTRSQAMDLLREKKPALHGWVTSTSWYNMDAWAANIYRQMIYAEKLNAVIPWACIQWSEKWSKGDPNPGTAFRIDGKGGYKIEPGYYLYKQLCRAGQPGTAVCRVLANDSEAVFLGFAANGTRNPDAFILINMSEKENKKMRIEIKGSSSRKFAAYRTSPGEQYTELGVFEAKDGDFEYDAPVGSVTTFFGK